VVKKKQNKIVLFQKSTSSFSCGEVSAEPQKVTFPHEQKMVIHLGVLITPIDNPSSKQIKVTHQ
jgi:hypothetical protein